MSHFHKINHDADVSGVSYGLSSMYDSNETSYMSPNVPVEYVRASGSEGMGAEGIELDTLVQHWVLA